MPSIPRAGAYLLRLSAVAVAVGLVGYFAICYRYADSLSRVDRHPIARTADYVAPTHEDVTFTTSDGLTLKGWWYTAPSFRQRAVVLVHGKDQDRIDSSFAAGRIASFLLANGYDALLFDLRGHGESDGLRWGLGKQEALDVAAAVDLAAQRAAIPRSRVAIIGESMGAGSAVMALQRIPDAGPLVLDSAYTSATTIVTEIGPSVSGLPTWFTPGMVLMAGLFFGLDVNAVVPIEQVRTHPERAFFFVQCTEDKTVALHHGLELKAASANPATELWVASDCGHVRASTRYPAEWDSRVLAFLESQLK